MCMYSCIHVHELVCTCVCTVHENICAFVSALHEHVCTCVHILLCMCVLVQDKGQSEMSASETPSTLFEQGASLARY